MNFKDYPKPKSILNLSCEDIYECAKNRGQKLSREQIISIFDSIEVGDSEVIQNGFWELIEERIDQTTNSTENEITN